MRRSGMIASNLGGPLLNSGKISFYSSSGKDPDKGKPLRLLRNSRTGMDTGNTEQNSSSGKDTNTELPNKNDFIKKIDLGPPPEKPLPGDCCGTGCERCVWDIYFDELDEYNKKKKEIESKNK